MLVEAPAAPARRGRHTIAIVDEQPAEVFRYLYIHEKPMRFKAASEEDRDNPPSGDALGEFEEESHAVETDFVPYDASEVNARHQDGFLQTTSTTEALDKSLRRIDEQAQVSVEELGVNTLFLTLGMLHYQESRDSSIVLKAPLVLLPVQLARKTARAGYTLAPGDDDPLVNRALREYLKRSYGITLPDLPASDAITDEYDLQAFFGAVRDAVAAQEHWAIKTDIFLGLFSFQKFVMYKDLEGNTPAFISHRLIRRLVTRAGARSSAADQALDNYRRPNAQPYVITPDEGLFAGSDIMEADESVLSRAIQDVVALEAPIHVAELMTRVAGMWGNKRGSRIQARILDVASRLVGKGTVRRRGDFFWGAGDSCPVRSRAQTKIPADRIAPEEFEQAVLTVLAGRHCLPRPVLTAEVRSVLGYSRTGAIIEEAVSEAISRLLTSGSLGEGSTGLVARVELPPSRGARVEC